MRDPPAPSDRSGRYIMRSLKHPSCRAGDAAEARGTGFPRELDCLGAVLSARGIPTPNFFTGAYNFHSRFEFLPVQAFERSLEVAAKIWQVAASSRQFHGACQQASLRISHSGAEARKLSSRATRKCPAIRLLPRPPTAVPERSFEVLPEPSWRLPDRSVPL